MTDWPVVPLGEVVDLINGDRGKNYPRAGDRVASGIPFINAGHLSNGRVRLNEMDFITPQHHRRLRSGQTEVGDVLLCIRGSLGRAALVTDSISEGAIASSLVILRSSEQIDPRFLLGYLEGPIGSHLIASNDNGAAQPNIGASTVARFGIPLPPIETQRRIVGVLRSVDDLIENNRRRIEVLEEMAQAIYREWFVHFRFPGHEDATFVGSPLGPIPEGWEAATLEQLAHLTMGQSPKSEFYNESGEGSPFHQGVKDFGPHFPTHRTYCTVDARAAKEGDILISVRAPVGRLNIAPSDLTIGRGLAAARAKSGHQSLLFYGLKLTAFAVEDAMGSGTIFKAITKKDLTGLRVPWPTPDLADRASSVLSPMVALIHSHTMSNVRLTAVRDLLLPKLVSGEIDVSDLDLDAVLEGTV